MKTLNKILIGVLGIGVAAVVGLPICAILYMGPPFPWGHKVDSRYDTYYKNHKGIYYISNWNFAMWLNSLHWEYLKDVDEKSFVVVDEAWAKDSSHVWHHDKLIGSADAESFHVNQTGVPVDRYNVFKIEDWTYVHSKSGIDPSTAEYFVY